MVKQDKEDELEWQKSMYIHFLKEMEICVSC